MGEIGQASQIVNLNWKKTAEESTREERFAFDGVLSLSLQLAQLSWCQTRLSLSEMSTLLFFFSLRS